MLCPKCKSEYETGCTVCSDCNIELIDELPTPNMIGKPLSSRYTFFIIVDLFLGIIGGIFLFIAFAVMFTNGQPGPYPPGDDTIWLCLIGLYIVCMVYFNIKGTILYCKIAETKFFSSEGIARFLLTLIGVFICIVISFYLIGHVLYKVLF